MRLRDGLLFLVCCSSPVPPVASRDTDTHETPSEGPTARPVKPYEQTPQGETSDSVEDLPVDCSVQGHGFVPPPVDTKEANLVIRYEACVLLTGNPPIWLAEIMTAWEISQGAVCGQIYRGILIHDDPHTGTHVGGRFMWSLHDYRPCELVGLPRLGTEPLSNWSFDVLGYVLWVAELPDVPYVVWTPDDRAVSVMGDGLHILATDR